VRGGCHPSAARALWATGVLWAETNG
jgi:hypothetical protein